MRCALLLLSGCLAGGVAPEEGLLEEVEREAGLPFLEGFSWPVADPVVASGFGPRRLASEGGRDDLHLGVDLPGELDADALAVAAGTVRSIDADPDGDAGLMLIVEHALAAPVAWQGREHDRVYAVYLHLDGVDVAEGDAVEAGQRLGGIGQSGSADSPHLHFELRIGTWCTARWMAQNPSSTCGWAGYDPAVNPVHALAGAAPGGVELLRDGELAFRVRVPAGDLDLDTISSDGGAIGLDARLGMDATSWEALDDLDYGWGTIEPAAFRDGTPWMELRLTFAEAPTWVEATDVWGVGVRWEASAG